MKYWKHTFLEYVWHLLFWSSMTILVVGIVTQNKEACLLGAIIGLVFAIYNLIMVWS